MTRITRTLIAILVFQFSIGAAAPAGVPVDQGSPERGGTTGSPTGHSISGGTLSERIRVIYGIVQYHKAGIDLPPVMVYIHEDYDGCNGHPGLFNKDGAGNRIDLCGNVVRHELAHVWTYHNLTDATRAEYVEYANLPTWGDQSYRHAQRGIEQAANIIAWYVGKQPLSPQEIELNAEFLRPYEMEFLHRYEMLTSTA